ncbi:MAG TPA: hypothetical protein VFO14_19065 [Vicinamibacterales bacterium]|nr:hypothetical protein [Vicinamibacterales bacterium]
MQQRFWVDLEGGCQTSRLAWIWPSIPGFETRDLGGVHARMVGKVDLRPSAPKALGLQANHPLCNDIHIGYPPPTPSFVQSTKLASSSLF